MLNAEVVIINYWYTASTTDSDGHWNYVHKLGDNELLGTFQKYPNYYSQHIATVVCST